jgi:hypothetical protein
MEVSAKRNGTIAGSAAFIGLSIISKKERDQFINPAYFKEIAPFLCFKRAGYV